MSDKMQKKNNDNFVVYGSWYEPVKGLTVEQKAEILDAMFHYNMGLTMPELSTISNIVFQFMKPVFDKNREKYNAICERNRENGEKGGRPRNPKKPKKPSGLLKNPKNPDEPKKANNDNDNKNDENDNDIDYDRLIAIFYQNCPNMPKLEKITNERKKAIQARITEHGKEKVVEVLKKAGKSKFLNAQNDKNWQATFDWLFRPNNFVKVLEGNYDDKNNNKKEPWIQNEMK